MQSLLVSIAQLEDDLGCTRKRDSQFQRKLDMELQSLFLQKSTLTLPPILSNNITSTIRSITYIIGFPSHTHLTDQYILKPWRHIFFKFLTLLEATPQHRPSQFIICLPPRFRDTRCIGLRSREVFFFTYIFRLVCGKKFSISLFSEKLSIFKNPIVYLFNPRQTLSVYSSLLQLKYFLLKPFSYDKRFVLFEMSL